MELLALIPVDVVPMILKHVAGENDAPVIETLTILGLTSPNQTNDYWLSVCREISHRPWLAFIPGVDYEWIYRILTSVFNGRFRQFEQWSDRYQPKKGFGLVSCGCCKGEIPDHWSTPYPVGGNIYLLYLPGTCNSAALCRCSHYACITQALLMFWNAHSDKTIFNNTLKYFFSKFPHYLRSPQREAHARRIGKYCAYPDTLAYLTAQSTVLQHDEMITMLNEICGL